MIPAACLVVAATLAAEPQVAPPPRPAGGYNLRGPFPVAVTVTRAESRLELTDGKMTVAALGVELTTGFGSVMEDEEETEVLAHADGKPTRVRKRVIRDEKEEWFDLGGEKKVVKTLGPLAGEVVLSERTGGGWAHRLDGGRKPNPDQANALLTSLNPEGPTDALPAGPVRPGATWELNSTHLRKYFGDEVRGLSGKMACRFLRVEAVAGEACAVVEMTGTLKGQTAAVGDTPEGTVAFTGTLTEYRSLATGVVLKHTAEMKVDKSFKRTVDGTEATVRVTGTVKASGTARAVR
jgi:hypothetical protein